jgi:Mg2+-importing ATPase
LASLFKELGSGPAGLTEEEAARRLARHGPNDPAAHPRKPPWQRLLRRFGNPLLLILLGASAVSAITGDLASFAIVVAIVLLSVTMDFVQELRAQHAVDALQSRLAVLARVLRDGRDASIHATRLVPGDVVKLGPGQLIPADGRLLDADALFVNESLLTGESFPVAKRALAEPGDDAAAAEGVAYAGTAVQSGSATMLVAATGAKTAVGAVGSALVGKASTAFEDGLKQFSALILRITIALIAIVFAESVAFRRDWLESLLFALALAVGLTPALLPMIVTVTLARGALRLARRRVLVKRLSAIHNLGGADVLCTDKTGTLTEATVRLVDAIDAGGRQSRHVFELAWLNSHFQATPVNPMDAALLAREGADDEGWRKLGEVPFDFARRRVSVLLERAGERVLIVKGAPEEVLHACATFEGPDRRPARLDGPTRDALRERFEQAGARGCRTLGVAYRSLSAPRDEVQRGDEADLVFVGFAVFMDPPRASAGAAIERLERDSVEVKVLTGDHERVAHHLCKELKIPMQGTVTGAELDALADPELINAVQRCNLFCRVTPLQKLRVISALKQAGKTVAFLGDGINDAPALNAADVGISVDTGTDVAKAAADIVLLERDLSVLHAGVLEGRRTVVNVRKYILMASSANFGNIVSMALAGLFLPFLPLLPIQVLLTNLLYDFAQTGLPFDEVDREELTRPVHWDMMLVERFMFILGPISTAFDALTFAVLLFVLHAGVPQFRTGWFIESLTTQMLMVFAVRTRGPLLASRPHPAVTALALALTLVTLALPFIPAGRWFRFAPLAPTYFIFLACALIGFLVMVEVAKRTAYRRLPTVLRRDYAKPSRFIGPK